MEKMLSKSRRVGKLFPKQRKRFLAELRAYEAEHGAAAAALAPAEIASEVGAVAADPVGKATWPSLHRRALELEGTSCQRPGINMAAFTTPSDGPLKLEWVNANGTGNHMEVVCVSAQPGLLNKLSGDVAFIAFSV